MRKTEYSANDKLADLAASIREIADRVNARRMRVSFVTARAMHSGSTEIISAVPWRRLPKSTRRVFKHYVENRHHRPRSEKSSERIFNLPGTSAPSWYLDASEPLPARLLSILAAR